MIKRGIELNMQLHPDTNFKWLSGDNRAVKKTSDWYYYDVVKI